jgi:hypothetical protein
MGYLDIARAMLAARSPQSEPEAMEGLGGCIRSIKSPQSPAAATGDVLPDPADRTWVNPESVDWAGPERFVPPGSPDPADAPWQEALMGWPRELREAWDERAAILEHEAGLARDATERRAFVAVVDGLVAALYPPEAPEPSR